MINKEEKTREEQRKHIVKSINKFFDEMRSTRESSMTTLNEFSPGDRVSYNHSKPVEFGIVSSKNDKYVFVRFDKQVAKLGWDGTTAQACCPSDLELIEAYDRKRR